MGGNPVLILKIFLNFPIVGGNRPDTLRTKLRKLKGFF